MYYFGDLYPNMLSRATGRKTLPLDLQNVRDTEVFNATGNIWYVLAVLLVVMVGFGYLSRRL